jgi:16S rRNA (adenine1518-N6/adenine1519-N6)-dimethyltransferase
MLGPAEIQELLERSGLDARRSLGQNFVADPDTVVRIARLAAVGPGDHVVEVGPGLGSLTLALVDTGAEVLAVEKDESLVPVLHHVLDVYGARGVSVLQGDALELDWTQVLDAAAGPEATWVLVANLPYNVAVPVIMGVLEHAPAVVRMVVMVQSEVAERIAAGPGGRTIGIPSIRVAWYGEAQVLGTVGPEVFVPQPRIDSALLGITRRPPPSSRVSEAEVMELVATAYRQRRKMLRSTLGSRVSPAVFEAAQLAPTARPEELDIAAWVRLTEALHDQG